MKQLVTSRVAALMAGAVFAVITACSDSGGADLSGPRASNSNDPRTSNGDTAKNGGTRDSSGSRRNPVSKYALMIHVGTPRVGAPDTLTTDPVPGATVTVYEQTYTFTQHPGADTIQFNYTVVASGAVDSNGDVTVPNLKGTSQYVVKAFPPPGSPLRPTNIFINQAFADPLKVLIILHGL